MFLHLFDFSLEFVIKASAYRTAYLSLSGNNYTTRLLDKLKLLISLSRPSLAYRQLIAGFLGLAYLVRI